MSCGLLAEWSVSEDNLTLKVKVKSLKVSVKLFSY